MLDISVSNLKIKNFHINVSNCAKKTNLANIVEDSDSEDTLIGNKFDEHIEIPSTQADYVDIPSTQAVDIDEAPSTQSPKSPVVIPTSDEDSEDECSKTVIENQTVNSLIEDIIPASPNVSRTRFGKTSSNFAAPVEVKRNKRQLNSSNSIAGSPSLSSPLRKLPKRVEAIRTPTRSAASTSKLAVSSITPTRSANTMKRLAQSTSTPVSPIRKSKQAETRTSMPPAVSSPVSRTRNMAKEEFKMDHVMTRKSLNALDSVRSTSRAEAASSSSNVKVTKTKEPTLVIKSSSARIAKKASETEEKKSSTGRPIRQRTTTK